MPETDLNSRRLELARRFIAALDRIVEAIHAELAKGRRPSRKLNEPELSFRDNGMPYISNGSSWEGRGPFQYADLLDQIIDPDRPFHKLKFPEGRFSEVEALIDYARAHPDCSPAYMREVTLEESGKFDLIRSQIEWQLAHAANRFFLCYGEVAFDERKRSALLAPFFRGLFDERVNIANIIPIALVKFSFDRVRLASNVYVIRMSDRLQRARWSVKAYGASGHDGVVAAATHAIVLTGWHWPNANWLQMSNNLAAHNPELRDQIEQIFAALRLVTGVSTGFAQELRVARGWTHFGVDLPPDVHAAGARRYPESFDNFGWMCEDLPTIDQGQMRDVGRALQQMRTIKNDRLALALRRMNAAMIRNDVADAILDATIALEILLSDGESQSISYKLRLRAAALARLQFAAPGSAADTSDAIKQIYEARSRIVHGGRRAKPPASNDVEMRGLALDTLRNILRILLEHPRYLHPQAIDAELLLGG